jgi:nucleoside-diphosphate-sugar epimerase
MKILLTGVTGFVGKAVWHCLRSMNGVHVIAALRRSSTLTEPVEFATVVGELSAQTNWIPSLEGVEIVVHCAARAHVRGEPGEYALAEFRRINEEGTLSLALQAAANGVRRFVFISSIGVNGVQTDLFPFTSEDNAAPHSPYAQSKYDAELGLRAIAAQTGLEVTIIRPPLVYGPGAPGNFGSLIRWLNRGLPLPLGAVTQNRRSLVALDNLVDLILTCVVHPRAANQTFLVSDGEDISTTELLRRIEKNLNRRVHLLPVPVSILKIALDTLGKGTLGQSLLCSLQVDISRTCGLLDWKPPVSLDEGMSRAVNRS